MKKIWLSILTILLTVGTVAGTAYALFSDTVSIQGISITTGNADLLINDGNDPLDVAINISGNSGLYPGYESDSPIFPDFALKNNSSAAINLKLSAKLMSASGDWDALKEVVSFKFVNSTDTTESSYYKLSEWNAAFRDLNASLNTGVSKNFSIKLKVDSTAGSEIAGKNLNNIVFNITGEQI